MADANIAEAENADLNAVNAARGRGKPKHKRYDVKFKLTALAYAEQKSGEAAAQHFGVDARRIREWKKNKADLLALAEGNPKRARLRGGGRKKVSEEVESELHDWIHQMRACSNRVSRKMIRAKAKEIFASATDKKVGAVFRASGGWVDKFIKRNNFSVRRRTTVAQKDASQDTEKLVNFLVFSTRMIESKNIQAKDIIAMDETAVWFDMVGSTTVHQRGDRTVTLKSTGHEKCHLTVVLAAKGDGTKLKPYVVFKAAVRDVKAMQNIAGVVIASSKNGWMNDDLTTQWLQKVVGKFSFRQRLLVWDSYRCHISQATKAELRRGYKIQTAVIPGGCTKHVQAPDVMWNQPFKAHLKASYDDWMAGDTEKTYTRGGNLRAPSRRLLVSWVQRAWEELDVAMLKKSFKVCGLTVAADGSEDGEIHCLKPGMPCEAGREMLRRAREQEEVDEVEEEADEEEEFNNELMIEEEDDEGVVEEEEEEESEEENEEENED